MLIRGRVKLMEGMRFLTRGDSGHDVIMDSSDDGDLLGPSPIELVVLAAGCCTAIDVVHILQRMHQPLSNLEVEIEAERSEEDPKVLEKLAFRYRVSGKGVREESVQRAIDLSTERYCSIGVMLRRAGVELSTNLESVDMQL